MRWVNRVSMHRAWVTFPMEVYLYINSIQHCLLLSPPQPVEVPTMLSGLRQQRMLMVQTISQYKFVYQVLIQFLKNSRLI